jgi:hypothetical protein
MQKGVTSEEAGQITMSTRGLSVIARQFHERRSIARCSFMTQNRMLFWSEPAANRAATSHLY